MFQLLLKLGRVPFFYFIAALLIAEHACAISQADLDKIGQRIFLNECGGRYEALVSWNEGEEFMSLGIGHFIWYPEGYDGPFDESFPALLKFIKDRDAVIPAWLSEKTKPACPWTSRGQFLRASGSDPRIDDLRALLSRTAGIQAAFIVNRMESSLPKMLDAASEDSRDRVTRNFRALEACPAGVYALVDYVNFKGEGISATERYKGRGWGLLQVLESMGGEMHGAEAVKEFVRSAKKILNDRVQNSPAARNEARWLKGWENRLNTYLEYS